MKKQSFFFAPTLVFGLAAASFFFTACRKESPIELDAAKIEALKANATVQNAVATAQDLIYETVSTSPALNTVPGGVVVGSCPVVTFTPKSATDSFPATLKIDFGTGCVWRGHSMAGNVVLTVSGKVSAGNATLAGSFNALSVDGTVVSGQVSLKTGSGTQAMRDLTFTMTNCTGITADGKTVTLESFVATRKQTEGQSTTVSQAGPTAIQDDAFELLFSGNGTGSDGAVFTISTPTALLRSMNCRWISIGKVEIKSGLKTASIDFGDGTCDDKALVKVGLEEKTINLP